MQGLIHTALSIQIQKRDSHAAVSFFVHTHMIFVISNKKAIEKNNYNFYNIVYIKGNNKCRITEKQVN